MQVFIGSFLDLKFFFLSFFYVHAYFSILGINKIVVSKWKKKKKRNPRGAKSQEVDLGRAGNCPLSRMPATFTVGIRSVPSGVT